MSVFDMVWSLAGYVESFATGFISLLGSIFGIFSTFYGMVVSVLSIFPSAWSTPILIGLSVVFLYTLWNWVKGIEIAGFKLG